MKIMFFCITMVLLLQGNVWAEEKNVATSQNEAEIPLQLEKAKKHVNEESSSMRYVLSIAILGMLGCGAYYAIRKYGKVKNLPQTQIKVITQHYLGPQRSLAIIRVAGESILIGVTDHNISLIKSLALLDEEVPETTPNNFSATLNNIEFTSNENVSALDEEFSMKGIKDVVGKKLKNMRTL